MKDRAMLVPVGLALVLLSLGVADAVIVESDLLQQTQEPGVADITKQPVQPDDLANGVRKTSGPSVEETLSRTGFTFQETRERTLIEQIIPTGDATVQKKVILRRGDRSGLVAWVESDEVKAYFLGLKEALHASFSPGVQDLIDETQQREGKPVRNFLTFYDPALSEERVVFARVRERLYELHLAKGKENALYDLLEELTN